MNQPAVVILGAGAAGLFLASRLSRRLSAQLAPHPSAAVPYRAAHPPAREALRTESAEPRIVVMEKLPGPGAKLAVSGGGRGNITFVPSPDGIAHDLGAYHEAQRFVRTGLHRHPPSALRRDLAVLGVPTVEEERCVYPATLRAEDVSAALYEAARHHGCSFRFREKAERVEATESGFVVHGSDRTIRCETLVIATGGSLSTACYDLLRDLGHEIMPPRPALASLRTTYLPDHYGTLRGDTRSRLVQLVQALQGVTLETEHGSLLFTHFGLSGPAILDRSRFFSVGEVVEVPLISCPAAEYEPAWMALAQHGGGLTVRAGLNRFTNSPRCKQIQLVIAESLGIADKRIAELSRQERRALCALTRALVFRIDGFRSPMLTRGGVSQREVRSETMESRLHRNLYILGEALDVDARTGGYNIQWAYSSACLAADAIESSR